MLTGKYRPGDAPPDGLAHGERARWAGSMGRFDSDELLERVQRLAPIAERLGITMAQLALAWVLREAERRRRRSSARRGRSRCATTRRRPGVELDAETLAEIDAALG